MHLLAALVALFSAAAALAGLRAGDHIVLLLAAAGFLCAFTTYQARRISTFLQIFAAIFAAETVIFGIIISTRGTRPAPASGRFPPSTRASGAWPSAWSSCLSSSTKRKSA